MANFQKFGRKAKFQKFASNKIRFLLYFEIRDFLENPQTIFLFFFYNVYKEKMFTIEMKMGAKCP